MAEDRSIFGVVLNYQIPLHYPFQPYPHYTGQCTEASMRVCTESTLFIHTAFCLYTQLSTKVRKESDGVHQHCSADTASKTQVLCGNWCCSCTCRLLQPAQFCFHMPNLGIRKESKQRRIIKNMPMKSFSQRFLPLSSQLSFK